jgi:hypothetical protein
MTHKPRGPWRPTHYLSPELSTGWVHDEYNRRIQADYLARWQEENRIEQLSELEKTIVNLAPASKGERLLFWSLLAAPLAMTTGFLVWLWVL